jgi:hypothetical protein
MKNRGTTPPIPRNSPPGITRGAGRAHLPSYSSRIIKAGALLTDTKSLLLAWDLNATVPQNLDRIRRENPFGKASRSRVEEGTIAAAFKKVATEELEQAMELLRDSLQKCIDEGAVIILE